MIGKTGIAVTDLAPKGNVSLDGIIWQATFADDSGKSIEKGSRESELFVSMALRLRLNRNP